MWDWFAALHETRQFVPTPPKGFLKPQPIPWVEIESWSRLTRTPLRPHEVALLRDLDRTWLAGLPKENADAHDREA